MNMKHTKPTVKTLLSGLLLGGTAVASLATTGCDGTMTEQVRVVASGSAEQIADLLEALEREGLPRKHAFDARLAECQLLAEHRIGDALCLEIALELGDEQADLGHFAHRPG